ncbi:ACP S-malonyltransferase [Streptomyces oceani]|uniref:[acyl-carrier-protein] S-malonyltransferase n=1 Tax=Streptomyces oceani TaxID=1075402 RepID=A0A1E7KLF5_9ACTN|nr:ACP S-malonyltransferase [Streptomyces oceani]OEV04758.1 ACP S-malonyltransferase [Streptomyces oceani]
MTAEQQGGTALVFPGMGPTRFADMAEFLATNRHARRRLATADEVLGYSVYERYRSAPDDYAEYAQIAFLVACLALADSAERKLGAVPELVTGPSFGQRAAAAYAQSLSFADTVLLTARLARCEEEFFAEEHREAVTHCVVHTPEDVLKEVLAELAERGEWYDISGRIDRGFHLVSLREPVLDWFKGRISDVGGYNMYTMWPPVHAPAFDGLRRKAEAEVFGEITVSDPKLPVVADQDGSVLTDAAGVRRMLLDTFDRPIHWPDIVATLRERGVRRMCVSGPDNLFTRVDSTREHFELVHLVPPRVRGRG